MARKKKMTAIPSEGWCSCYEWKTYEWRLSNVELMLFCPYCGNKLEKARKL